MIEHLITIGNQRFLIELRADLPTDTIAVKDFATFGKVLSALQHTRDSKPIEPPVYTPHNLPPGRKRASPRVPRKPYLFLEKAEEVRKQLVQKKDKLSDLESKIVIEMFGLDGLPPRHSVTIGKELSRSAGFVTKKLHEAMTTLGFNRNEYTPRQYRKKDT